ncbi:MAG: 2,3-bisphosphoglycerate-independent phosphoglycerate mutase [Patescibacteria group bacterium]|nr:2,3-bisphosphoglycerate-independent phosphoglycerate mutase [Patescibacteria group bacterium]
MMPVRGKPKPVLLLICDGWGVAPPGEGNPVEAANTPVFDELIRTYPTVTVRASGEAVGLSWGEMGNSEVGHLTIGAGKIFYQSLPRINMAIQTGSFFKNEVFLGAVEQCKKNDSTFHVMGIVSPGGVHGSDEHIYSLVQLAAQNGIKKIAVHAFLDGRDSIFNSGIEFVRNLQSRMEQLGSGRIADLSGRFWAMDRDNRWDRVEKAYNAITGKGADKTHEDPVKAIEESYANKVYDEEFVPTIITAGGQPVAPVRDGDALIFANFRPDRARQIAQAFCVPDFSKFAREPIKDLYFATMMQYEKGTPAHVAYPPEMVETCLAKVVSDAGLKQLHIAETEKYAHVTFFMNGMREEPLPGEERVIIPSPRVSSYDQAPAMSTPKLTDRIIKEIQDQKFDLIICNFANADMVGHTGKFEPTKQGVEVIDQCLGRLVPALLEAGGVMVMTADHGNGEEVLNLQTGEIDKEHSTNPVPFLVVGREFQGQASPSGETVGGDLSIMPPVGMLADTAPTVLKLLGVPQPAEMTGCPLI